MQRVLIILLLVASFAVIGCDSDKGTTGTQGTSKPSGHVEPDPYAEWREK